MKRARPSANKHFEQPAERNFEDASARFSARNEFLSGINFGQRGHDTIFVSATIVLTGAEGAERKFRPLDLTTQIF